MATILDNKLAGLAAGFTLGFGILTVWEAIKQTRSVTSPRRSHYIWMVWGGIASNVAIGIIAWLLIDGTLPPTVPVLFMGLFCWVWEIQLLMQIIINRTAVIVDDRRLMAKIKWGTALLITCVQIAVFCILIPTHSIYANPTFAQINAGWDPASKVIVLFVDAALNIFFIQNVRKRLVKYHGLSKYAALVTFNARPLVVSICMDIMIIGLMHLSNPMVYTAFHPVAYIVKLNIEMTMASLIKKIAQATVSERNERSLGQYTYEYAGSELTHPASTYRNDTYATASAPAQIPSNATSHDDLDLESIRTTKEVQVQVDNMSSGADNNDSNIEKGPSIDSIGNLLRAVESQSERAMTSFLCTRRCCTR